MSKYLLLSAFLLAPAFSACADQAAPRPATPAAAAPSADAQSQSDTRSDREKDFARTYCTSQTGTHLPDKDGVCPYGVSVSREEWQNRGGMTTGDFVRKGIP